MIELYEFLPNPVGKDTAGEYVAILNSGKETFSSVGWSLKDASGKTFALSGYNFQPGEVVRFPTTLTKLSLNNTGETISLFNPAGEIVDTLGYSGTALEGVAINKTHTLDPSTQAKLFEANIVSSMPVLPALEAEVIAIAIFSALLLALAASFVVHTIHGTKKESAALEPEWPA